MVLGKEELSILLSSSNVKKGTNFVVNWGFLLKIKIVRDYETRHNMTRFIFEKCFVNKSDNWFSLIAETSAFGMILLPLLFCTWPYPTHSPLKPLHPSKRHLTESYHKRSKTTELIKFEVEEIWPKHLLQKIKLF